jgi:histidyl-tRNA synthetase
VLHEVDRLGKQPRAEIEERLAQDPIGVPPATATRLLDTLTGTAGDSRATLAALQGFADPTPSFVEGLDELTRVYDGALALGIPERAFQIDLSIARGLDYYTGTVYETFLDEHVRLGSICSGGRYENLAGHYTKSKLPGVGISIGATRLFSQLLEMNVIGAAAQSVAQVVILRLEPSLGASYARLATELRAAGINVEVYGGDDKFGKQLKYADKAKVPLVVIHGSPEEAKGIVKVKDLRVAPDAPGGNEHEVARAEAVARIRALLVR